MRIRERMRERKEWRDWQKMEKEHAKTLIKVGGKLKREAILGLYLTDEERAGVGKFAEKHGKDMLRMQKQQRWKTSAFWRFMRWLRGRP